MASQILLSTFLFLLTCAGAMAQTPAPPQGPSPSGLRDVQVDAGKVVGTIHSFQGLNGPPFPIMQGLPNLVQ